VILVNEIIMPDQPHSQASAGRFYPWAVVGLLWLVCFLNYADRQATSSVLPLLQKEFGFDAVQLGWIGSAFAWVYAVMAPLAGVAADRVSRKRLIVAACLGWSFFTLATGWCGGLLALVAVRALTGLGETFYFPSAMSLVSDYHGPGTRSRAMAWHQSAVYAGTILGSWLAAVLAERHGWRAPFYCFGPAGMVLALILVQTLREPPRAAAGQAPAGAAADSGFATGQRLPILETMAVILRTPAALALMAAFLGANFVAVIFLTWTPLFLVEKFHYSFGAAGLTGTLYIHLASAMSVPLAGWLADQLSGRLATGRMMVQATGLAAGSIFIFLVGHTGQTTTLLLAMIGFGLCKGFYDSGIFAALYDVVEPRARGSAAGLMYTVGWAGGGLGPLFVGLATKYGHEPTRIANMSAAIAFGGVVYLAAAGAIVLAMFFLVRQRELEENTKVIKL
jgi:MFS family permease